jgi:hypothetical protein
MQIVFVTNVITIITVAIVWVTGHLSWPIGSQIFVLWLLLPFGITWSWPEGKPLSIWRTILSCAAIGIGAAVIGWLVRGLANARCQAGSIY